MGRIYDNGKISKAKSHTIQCYFFAQMPLLKIAKHQPHSPKENPIVMELILPFAISVHMGRATTVKYTEEEILEFPPKV